MTGNICSKSCLLEPSSSQTMGLSPQAFSPTHGSTMLHSLVHIIICMNHINQSNFIQAKFTRRALKDWTNHLTPFKCHFERLNKMAATMAKINQVFEVEKLNPQQEETTKSLLHYMKFNYLSHRKYNNCKKSTDLHNIS